MTNRTSTAIMPRPGTCISVFAMLVKLTQVDMHRLTCQRSHYQNRQQAYYEFLI